MTEVHGGSDGAWAGRPAGLPAVVPPPSVPLAFLAAAAFGLVACGVALVVASHAASVDPTADPVVAATHLGLLATLSMAVLGALHQFVPVVTQHPLRSVGLARLTFGAWLGATWLLPLGIGWGEEAVVEAGGALAATAIGLVVVNLAPALWSGTGGVTTTGLRFAVGGLVVTGCFGVVYVADRRGSWFDLSGHVVLAHAVVGLFAWLGLAYVAVAEKLLAMFLLSHPPGRRAGRLAVWAIPAGTALASPGVLLGWRPVAVAGAVVLAVGLGAHLVSLAAHLRHRSRRIDLHAWFVVTSAGFLATGAALGAAGAGTIGSDHPEGMALVAAAVAAVGGWLLVTLVGHLHKVVPFIAWSALRARGVRVGREGRPLRFADLYDHTAAGAAYGLVVGGVVAVVAGLASRTPVVTEVGGWLLVATGVTVAVNLASAPLRLLRRATLEVGHGEAAPA